MTALLPAWFDPGDERAARAVWSRLTEPVDRQAARLVAAEGPAGALRVFLSGHAPADDSARWHARLASFDPGRDQAALARVGGRLVVPGDEEWPEPLDALGPGRPLCLWVRGPRRLDQVSRRAVALVGARACTEYGEQVTRELAVGCADRGITVVSGAAFGIDASAHAGALGAGGPTVAVLASGVDRPYPRGNVPLIERIVAEGVLVSEVPPGSSPTRNRFVTRNRLIAALAGATVVVEAGWRSGATITAGAAADLGRSVGAVPGPVTSPASVGCHRLLREGVTCVTSPAEVAELVDPLDAAAGQQLELPPRPYDDLSPTDLRVYDALPLGKGAPLPSIAAVAGLDTPAVLASLGRLDLLGLAARNGEAWRRSPRGAA